MYEIIKQLTKNSQRFVKKSKVKASVNTNNKIMEGAFRKPIQNNMEKKKNDIVQKKIIAMNYRRKQTFDLLVFLKKKIQINNVLKQKIVLN